jgi:pimeloyl-ACP methyl ester carboxylesterase
VREASGTWKVNGIDLFVHRVRDEAAPSSGLTVLLVHGLLDNGATWDRVAAQLAAAGHDVLAPDLRGFGQSSWVGAGGYYHFPDYVADLAALVESLAPARLGLVGHSMGGSIAVYYTGTFPARVERLALLEGLGPMDNDPEMGAARMEAWLRDRRRVDRTPRALGSLEEAAARLADHHPRVPRDVLAARAAQLTRVDESGRLVWAYDPLHRTTAPTPFYAAHFKAFLRQITCPTLVVGGGPLGWHVPDAEERVACLQSVERFDLEEAGHMMHWTQPEALGKRLARFFGGA